MSYGKLLAKIKEAGETISLQENGSFYNFQSTISGSHRLLISVTSPERLQAHWDIFWGVMMDHVAKTKYLKEA